MNTCSKHQYCNAPLCPLNEGIENHIWYPDEEICTRSEEEWVKVQKKIKGYDPDSSRYFTLEMLSRGCVVGKRMEGLDPEEEEGPQLKEWMAKHPERGKRVLQHRADGKIRKVLVSRR